MNTETKEALDEVFCEAFEKLAFMFGEPTEKEELEDTKSEFVWATLSFSGHQSGHLRLAVAMDICPEIAANMLGVEPEEITTQDSKIDAFKELVNVACGHFLTWKFGEEAVFDLSVPKAATCSSTEWVAFLKEEDTLAYLMDDYPVLMQFQAVE